jgi:uncharacterized protein YndB with AHSA1/START domain
MTDTDAWGVLSSHPDGSSIVRFERRFATSPGDLWSAVTQPERVTRWLGALYGDLVTGGRYELRMGSDVPDSAENATGQIVACDPPNAFEVTWAFPTEEVTHVSVAVRADPDDAGAAVLVLVHSGLEVAAREHAAGWHACLDQLEDHVGAQPLRAWQDAFDAVLARYRGEV